MNEAAKRTIRTALAVVISLAAMLPVLVSEAGLDAGSWPWLGAILAAAAAVTRVMALPQVNALLERFGIGMTDGKHEAGRVGDAPADGGAA